jgi:citrate lyase subunit beta/citryl-CoA lyase
VSIVELYYNNISCYKDIFLPSVCRPILAYIRIIISNSPQEEDMPTHAVVDIHRPRRSALYIPGSNARALEKAKDVPADCLILDLEDAVAPDAKVAARDAVVAAACTYAPREVLIRANGLATPWGYDDVRAIAHSGADGIVLPKVESADTLCAIRGILQAEKAANLPIWAMIETPKGVLHAQEIVQACPNIVGLIMGTSDLAKDLRCAHTPDRAPFATAFGMCILAARAHGKVILDGVHLDLNDDDGFAAACQQGRDFGFDGKTLIHPKTIAVANTIFGPSEDDIAYAIQVVEAYQSAVEGGQGVAVLNGRLVENLHVEEARRVLKQAQVIKKMLKP